jgi:hypothetical protein
MALRHDLGKAESDIVNLEFSAPAFTSATFGSNLKSAGLNGNELLTAQNRVSQDVTAIGHDIGNVYSELRKPPSGGNLADDVIAVAYGDLTMKSGFAMLQFGVEASGTMAGAEIGIPMAIAGVNIAEDGAALEVAGSEQLYNDLVSIFTHGQQQSAPTSTSTPTPTPTPKTPSDAGTWTATLVPDYTSGNVTPNSSQKVTLVLNPNGSGSLSLAPYAGSGITVKFPAGTAQFNYDGSGVSVVYDTPNGLGQIDMDVSLSNIGRSSLHGVLYVYNENTDDYADFESAILNR